MLNSMKNEGNSADIYNQAMLIVCVNVTAKLLYARKKFMQLGDNHTTPDTDDLCNEYQGRWNGQEHEK